MTGAFLYLRFGNGYCLKIGQSSHADAALVWTVRPWTFPDTLFTIQHFPHPPNNVHQMCTEIYKGNSFAIRFRGNLI